MYKPCAGGSKFYHFQPRLTRYDHSYTLRYVLPCVASHMIRWWTLVWSLKELYFMAHFNGVGEVVTFWILLRLNTTWLCKKYMECAVPHSSNSAISRVLACTKTVDAPSYNLNDNFGSPVDNITFDLTATLQMDHNRMILSKNRLPFSRW